MTVCRKQRWRTGSGTGISKDHTKTGNNMDLLRFITAGSVDDGKSTLIGRLLYDSKSILVDQLEAVERASRNREQGEIDLALLTDGLRAEREQGITIDVAYKYFSTPERKFVIADAPGHVQYTRNMITGASNAELIILLVDARNGIVEQTRRHSIIASLLDIPNVVVAINKMDLVDYSEDAFLSISKAYAETARQLGLKNVFYIPISALSGDNIVEPSAAMAWYQGETLLHLLEHVPLRSGHESRPARFPVQYVIRPQTRALHDYRGYAGRVASGVYRKGDAVTVLPSGHTSTIQRIEIAGKEVQEAVAQQSVVLHLEDDIDISRGDLIVGSEEQPAVARELDALVCWMDHKPLIPGGRYAIQLNTKAVPGIVSEILYKVDVNTLAESPAQSAGLNEIVRVKLKTASPLAYDPYRKLSANGGIIFIDETSNVTVGAGLLQ